MKRDDLTDLNVFLAVAEERSFTRAAARLGLTQSTLSHSVRSFEQRLGVRLLTRNTRSVAPTEAGERLLQAASPRLAAIEVEIAALSALRNQPAGTIRITSSTHAYETILWPMLRRFVPEHPEIKVEVTVDNRLTDIVTDRFDAGIRLGEEIDRDMIAARIGPEMRYIVVAAPAYIAEKPGPAVPQELTGHRCVNLRRTTSGEMYAWEFEKDGRALRVRVDGPLAVNDAILAMDAALEGFGLAYVPEDIAALPLRQGRLVQVLDDWCQPFPGYHLYYPSRRQMAPAFAVLVEALRYRG